MEKKCTVCDTLKKAKDVEVGKCYDLTGESLTVYYLSPILRGPLSNGKAFIQHEGKDYNGGLEDIYELALEFKLVKKERNNA